MRARILPFRRRGLPWSAAVLVALLGIAAWSPRAAGGEPRPDVVSTGLTLTPASARAGDPVTAVVTVRNQGTGPAGPSLVGLYLGTSSGSSLTSAIPLGAIAVGALAPGASQAVSRSFTVPGVAPGTFTVIAVVDGATTLLESSETNNRRTASLRVTLADLTVARVTLAPSHARTGDTVTATAVIRNGGQVPAQASAVRLLFETGAGAPPAVVGSRSTEPLAAGESRELSFTFTVPSVPARRAYYVWAQVDADGGLLETNEGNNRNGAWLDVTIPDLTISGLSLRPAPARAGDPVSAIVVVRNSSPVPAGGTTLRLYFETAAGAPTSTPTLLGTATVDWLNPGESREMSLPFTVPAVPHGRSYYVWAQVDADGGLLETNEGNNRRGTWLKVTIPDLTIASLAVRPAPARAGDPVAAAIVVRNSGQVPANASSLRLYFETAAGTPPTLLGTVAVGTLSPGHAHELSVPFTVPAVPHGRSYYVWAQVDAEGGLLETNEGNNRRGTWLKVTIPDLTVASLAVRPAPARAGDPVAAAIVVRNGGQVPANASSLRLYFERAATTPPSPPILLGTVAVGALNPGQAHELSVPFTVPAVPHGRSYHVWAEVDPDSGLLETNEGNNRRGTWLSVTIPDLSIVSLAVRPAPARAGDPVTAAIVVRNGGQVPANASSLRLYFETATGTPPSPPTLLGTVAVGALNPGQARELSVPFTVPAVPHGRSYYVWAQADPDGGLLETNEGNNRGGAWVQVAVPDLSVETLSVAPNPAAGGAAVTVALRVRNRGSVPANATRASLHVMTTSSAALGGVAPLTTIDVPALGPGKEAPLTFAVGLPMLSPGPYHLIAVADSAVSQTENTEANNRRSTGFEVSVPAFTVDALDLSPSVVQAGQTATASVRIANRGRVSSRPTTADVFLATSAAADLSEGIHVRTLAVDRLPPGASVTLPVPLGVPAVDPGDYYVIAQVDASTAVGGLTTMVASASAASPSPDRPRLSLKLRVNQPDLISEALTLSAALARPGDSVTVGYTVRNGGSTPTGAAEAGVYVAAQAEHQPLAGDPAGDSAHRRLGPGSLDQADDRGLGSLSCARAALHRRVGGSRRDRRGVQRDQQPAGPDARGPGHLGRADGVGRGYPHARAADRPTGDGPGSLDQGRPERVRGVPDRGARAGRRRAVQRQRRGLGSRGTRCHRAQQRHPVPGPLHPGRSVEPRVALPAGLVAGRAHPVQAPRDRPAPRRSVPGGPVSGERGPEPAGLGRGVRAARHTGRHLYRSRDAHRGGAEPDRDPGHADRLELHAANATPRCVGLRRALVLLGQVRGPRDSSARVDIDWRISKTAAAASHRLSSRPARTLGWYAERRHRLARRLPQLQEWLGTLGASSWQIPRTSSPTRSGSTGPR